MTVIYLFVSPSGRAYAGRHTCQHEGWPRRGSGALPSGYRGSGNVWRHVVRKHGPAIRWIILRRFSSDAAREAINDAERRAIRLARHLWADRCMNVYSGGEGLTPEEAKALWADPDYKAKMVPISRAHIAKVNSSPEHAEHLAKLNADPAILEARRVQLAALRADPELQARRLEAVVESNRTPEVRAKVSAGLKAWWATPEGQAQREKAAASLRPETIEKMRASHKALAQTPERKAQLETSLAAGRSAMAAPEVKAKVSAKLSAAAKARWADPEWKARLMASNTAAYSPEAIAKSKATKLRNRIRAANARNKARREAAMEEQQ